jgi:beta-fructofuranosidase
LLFPLPDAPIEIRLDGPLEGTSISATQQGRPSFSICVKDGTISVSLPQDDGSIQYESTLAQASNLRFIYDRGIVEIFADQGAICGTRRSYLDAQPDRLAIQSGSSVGVCRLVLT